MPSRDFPDLEKKRGQVPVALKILGKKGRLSLYFLRRAVFSALHRHSLFSHGLGHRRPEKYRAAAA